MGTKRKVISGSICSIHDLEFAEFSYGRSRSYGCPTCTDRIREHVRKERANFRQWHAKAARTRMRPSKATA